MGLGSIFVSVAVLIGVVAYVAWPFRYAGVDVDQAIESWVARARADQPRGTQTPADGPAASWAGTEGAAADGNAYADHRFCPFCGRQVEPDHIFCPKCGKQVVGERGA